MSSPRVAYFMDSDIGGFYYGQHHPMKPHRISMVHNLVLAYGLYTRMDVYQGRLAPVDELSKFHADDYIDFLRRVNPDNAHEFARWMQKFNVGKTGGDCPLFDGLFEFCQRSAAGSIDGARKIMAGRAQIAVNWAGGLHHAKKGEASGFCYVNDIVLAILELLQYFPRVLYVDVDVHHGDGVEEAFYVTDRVMTVSFHKYGDGFFPGTGDIWDKGAGPGEYYSINVPLKDGIDDASYEGLFEPIISKVIEVFQPSAIVLQCGADSLASDRLGCFNLTIKGHGKCVRFIKSFGIPTLVVGGGGYNIRSVARCWAYETAVVLNEELENRIPYNDYWEYFAPDFQLHIKEAPISNYNSRDFLEAIKIKTMENLRNLTGAPSVQMQELPPANFEYDADDEERADPDVSEPVNGKRLPNNEFFDDNKDQGMEARA